MNLKSCEKKVKILERMLWIPGIGLCGAVPGVLFASTPIVPIIFVIIFLIAFVFLIIKLQIAEVTLIEEKVNYYLKDNEYTEVFLRRDDRLMDKRIYDLIEENNLTFVAQKFGDSILIKGMKGDIELFSCSFNDYCEFFDYFNVEKV